MLVYRMHGPYRAIRRTTFIGSGTLRSSLGQSLGIPIEIVSPVDIASRIKEFWSPMCQRSASLESAGRSSRHDCPTLTGSTGTSTPPSRMLIVKTRRVVPDASAARKALPRLYGFVRPNSSRW